MKTYKSLKIAIVVVLLAFLMSVLLACNGSGGGGNGGGFSGGNQGGGQNGGNGSQNGGSDVDLLQSSFLNVSYGVEEGQTLNIFHPRPAGQIVPQNGLVFMVIPDENEDKDDFSDLIELLTAISFLNIHVSVVVINYSENALDSISLALQFIYGRGADFRLRNDRVALIGNSFGGYLALLHTLTRASDVGVPLVITLGAPTANLMQYITANNAPALFMMHGLSDSVTPFYEMINVFNLYNNLGLRDRIEIVMLEGAGHNLLNYPEKIEANILEIWSLLQFLIV